MTKHNLINIGFGNIIAASRLISVVTPDSSPIKRIVQESKEKSLLIDATCGKKTKSVIIMDTGHIVLSGLQVRTISNRLGTTESGEGDDDE